MVAINKGIAMLAALPALASASRSHSNVPFSQIPQATANLGSQLLEVSQSGKIVGFTMPKLDSQHTTHLDLSDYSIGMADVPVKANDNPLEQLSYNKGDQAKSLKEFSKEVQEDYQVNGNRAARNNRKFSERAIMIYGEEHTDIRIPSIRNNKGALLLESDDARLCLNKHKHFESNLHLHIDSQTDADTHNRYRPFIHALTDLVDSIDYLACDRIRSEIKPTDSGHVYINKLLDFVEGNFEKAYQGKLEWERPWFKIQHDRVFELKAALLKDIESGLDARNEHMIDQASQVIAKLADDESATIVVGARDLKPIAEALNKKFGRQMPVVACLPNSVARPEFVPKL